MLASDGTSTQEERTSAVTEQRATMFKRDREGYANFGESGLPDPWQGFKRNCFRSPQQNAHGVMAICKACVEKGDGYKFDGHRRRAEGEIKALQFEYECISFLDPSTGKKIHAVRATNVSDVITRTVELLKQRNQLELLANNDDDALWIHVSGDKGGKSTKVMMQVINANNRHSIKSAKILGMFEGGKDSGDNIELAFKPIFDQIKQLAEEFNLDFNRPTRSQQSE